jgi:hypothetical protein
VFRGVGLRRAKPRSHRRRRGGRGRLSALRTKLRRRGELPAAVGAGPGKRRSALLAELRIRLVFVLAAGTPHDGTSLPQREREVEDADPPDTSSGLLDDLRG